MANNSVRIGQREIARALAVSPMTVSLALRNHPSIPEATRLRVRDAAERLGYRPDPELARLMARLRTGHSLAGSVTIALVDPSRTGRNAETGYHGPIARGARERAAAMGFEVAEISCDEMVCRLPRLLKILHARGVAGVILLPPIEAVELPLEADWSGFAVVNTSTGITPDLFNRVVPHNFFDMCRVLKRLEAAGYRRIGFVLESGFDERSLFQFTAAIQLQGYGDGILRVPPRATLRLENVAPWLDEFCPDIVLTHCVEEVHALLRGLPAPPRLYSIGAPRMPGIAYWDQKPYEIGTHAVTLLAGMLRDSEYGVPAQPTTTSIHGEFHDDLAVPAEVMSDRKVAVRACLPGR